MELSAIPLNGLVGLLHPQDDCYKSDRNLGVFCEINLVIGYVIFQLCWVFAQQLQWSSGP